MSDGCPVQVHPSESATQHLHQTWGKGTRSVILLMEEILHQLRLVVYPIIYRVLYIPGGCLGFLPSTVLDDIGYPISEIYFKSWLKHTLIKWEWSSFKKRSCANVCNSYGDFLKDLLERFLEQHEKNTCPKHGDDIAIWQPPKIHRFSLYWTWGIWSYSPSSDWMMRPPWRFLPRPPNTESVLDGSCKPWEVVLQ